LDAENGNVSCVSESAQLRVRSVSARLVFAALALVAIGAQTLATADEVSPESTHPAGASAPAIAQPEHETAAPATTHAPEGNEPVDAEGLDAASVEAIQRLMDEGRDEDALAQIDIALGHQPDNVELLLLSGAAQRRLHDVTGAIATYERVLQLDPDDASTPLLLALLLLEASLSAEEDEAYALLERAMQLSESAPSIAEAFLEAAHRSGNHDGVVRAYEQLPEENRNQPERLAMTASSLAALKRNEDAANLYALLLNKNPADIESARSMVKLLMDAELHQTAIEKIDAILANDPENVELLLLKAQVVGRQGTLLEELDVLLRVVRLKPDNSEAANRLAERLLQLGCLTPAQALIDSQEGLINKDTVNKTQAARRAQETQWQEIDAIIGFPSETKPAQLVIVGYEDVRFNVQSSPNSVNVAAFVEQLEYMAGHGFQFISDVDVYAAQRGKRELPKRAILLTFDRGFATFAKNVLPLLKVYEYPAIVALATEWIDGGPPAGLSGPLMNWDTVHRLPQEAGITLASMTHKLGNFVVANPQSKMSPAATTRLYSPNTSSYESPAEYRARIAEDVKTSQQLIRSKADRQVDILIWPDGQYNAICLEEAIGADYALMLAKQSEPGPSYDRRILPQRAVRGGMSLSEFATKLYRWAYNKRPELASIRAMPLNLDAVASTSTGKTRQNLLSMLERVAESGVNTVFLRAYADPDDDGTAEAVYFPNRVLPVRQDLLNHAVSLLQFRGISVYVTMPALSIKPPTTGNDDRRYINEYRWGRIQVSSLASRRLSPFHPDTTTTLTKLYEDLAAAVDFEGVLFENDAFMTEDEDFSISAAKVYRDTLNLYERNPEHLDEDQIQAITALKVKYLESLLAELRASVKRYRPSARLAREIHAAAVINERADVWLAQNFKSALDSHDAVLIPVSPEAYSAVDPMVWLNELTVAAIGQPLALEKAVFSIAIQAPQNKSWLSRRDWARRVNTLSQLGARHFSYFPDRWNTDSKPTIHNVKSAMAIDGSIAQ
jgi:biofilm PGA synthesis lipoprotein PgaB